MRKEIVLLAGTRPEAVKLAPLAVAANEQSHFRPVLVHSGQHGDIVDQTLGCFGLAAAETIRIDRATGSQAELYSLLLPELDRLLSRLRPAAVVVHGDTSTTLAGALAAFWQRIPVVHLEAGLRTGNLDAPFPEEANRQLVARIAALHLAPTKAAAVSLEREAPALPRIEVTGNTVVDAVRIVAERGRPPVDERLRSLRADIERTGGRILLCTLHRRESWGARLDRIVSAVATVLDEHPDVRVLLPLHPNPAVREQVERGLGGHPRVWATEPLDYPDLIHVLARSALVLTDSGGIQEEAPSFRVPVLVAREHTERAEAVESDSAWLVGADEALIRAECARLLRGQVTAPSTENPYGDGYAASRSLDAIERLCAAHAG